MNLRCRLFGHRRDHATVIDGKLYDCCQRCLEPYREVLPGQQFRARQVSQPKKWVRDEKAIADRERKFLLRPRLQVVK